MKNTVEWVNTYVLVLSKAQDSTPGDANAMRNDSFISNEQYTHIYCSAEKFRRADIPAKRIRVCLDPRQLNEALVREPYYTWSDR